jgi:diamine N-acetyltransferase
MAVDSKPQESSVSRSRDRMGAMGESAPRRPGAIRRARTSDAAALAALAERTFRDAFAAQNRAGDMEAHCAASYGEVQQAGEIANPAIETWLVESDGELIAYAQLRRGFTAPCVAGTSPLEIQRFYVDARWHGRGVADDLMAHLLERVRAAGADVVWLGVWEHNPRAIRFYTRWGFAAVGDQEFRLGGDPQRDLVLERRQPAS